MRLTTKGTRKSYVTTSTTGPGRTLDFKERNPLNDTPYGLPKSQRIGDYNIEFRRETFTGGYEIDVTRSGDGSAIAQNVKVGRIFSHKCTDPMNAAIIKVRLSKASRRILIASVQELKTDDEKK